MSTDTISPSTLKQRHAEISRLIAFSEAFDAHLKVKRAEYADALYAAYEDTGSKSFIHSFDDDAAVTFTLRGSDDTFKVTDPEAFADFVGEHFPSEVETVVAVRDSFKKSYLKRLEKGPDGMIVDPRSGLVVEGVSFVKGGVSKSFQPSWKGDGKQAAIHDLLASGALDTMLAITAGGEDL